MKDSFIRRFFATLGSMGLYILAFLLGVFLVFTWFHTNFVAPLDSDATETASFEVQAGWSLQQLAQELEKQELIKNWWSVYWLAKLRKGEKNEQLKLTPGEYELSPAMPPGEILEKLKSGRLLTRQLVLPEGALVRDAAKLIAETKLVTEEEANDALRDQALMAQLGIPAFTPEGYLVAGEYGFSRPINARQIVVEIVETGRKRLEEKVDNWQGRASELGFRPYEILTLASILEKEATETAERKNISAVLHNRLRIGMQLQSNAALAYGIPDFDGTVTKEHIQSPGPYNTYINVGLPPTPICTPSFESVEAALYPADADYLYFFKHPDGSFVYAATFKQHQENLKRSGLNAEAPPAPK